MKKFLFAPLALLLATNLNAEVKRLPELVVKMKPQVALPQIANAKSIQHLFGDVYVIRGNDLSNLKMLLDKNPQVVYTEENHRSLPTELPRPLRKVPSFDKANLAGEFNDPKVSKVWSFLDAKDNGISVNSAYRQFGTTNTAEVIVAVVDTGVDIDHEDLKANIWVNKKEIPGNGIDDDNNGYIDDINGINTLVRDSSGKATVNVRDGHSHGTHVSGTIAAIQNNGVGIAGIASNVKIIALRTVPSSGDETDVDVAEAFIYAAKNGAKIINCSFGKSRNEGKQLIPDTLKYIADNYGVLVIAAAGNDSKDIDRSPTYPASFNNENLLVIASTGSSGSMSYFSNYGKVNVDVAAPGSDIYSTVPGSKYDSMSGTSMATPTTVGLAAEILAHHPNLTHSQLKEVIIKSVTPVTRFKDKIVSGGRIDLLKAHDLARTY